MDKVLAQKESFVYPAPLDANEQGGKLSLYAAPLLPEDSAVSISQVS
ncbi:MAG TPA: hypothetical protein VHK86_02540 [Nitrososphaera sp.]|nr:hypothetical protein [Nitrososphaera sp.]HEX2614750.1 hypothetical protein [Nitrososphaera sp.]